MAEIKKISTELQLLDKFLDTSGDAGTSGQVLTSTGTGINWVSGGSLPGGPYLPLSAGSSFPLTGDLYLDDDSGATPSLYFKNGANNFWRYLMESGGDFSIKEGTSTRLTFQAGGNVGIGTTSPSAKLEVNGALFVGNHTGTVTPTDGIWIEGADGTSTQIQMYSLNGSVFNIKNAATKATIGYGSSQNRSVNFTNTGTGNISVGIGTDSPGYKLTVSGDAGFSDWIYASKFYPTSSTTDILMQTGAGRTITLDPTSTGKVLVPNGNVGIGTTSPGAVLSVRNPTAGTSTFSLQHSTTSSVFDFQTGIANITGDALVIKDVANSYDYITLRSGNVGIGTTSPTSPLAIKSNSTSSSSSGLTIQANGNTNDIFQLGEKSTDGSRLQMLDAGVVKIALYSDGTDNYINAGNVGIGTTAPGEKLEVVGNIRTNVGNGLGFMLTGSSASGLVRNAGTGLALRTNSIDKLIIDSTGSVTFSAYTGTNEQGTPTYLLGTDASGNVVKTNTVPGSGAGPYLPLTAGSGFSLTDSLYVNGVDQNNEGRYGNLQSEVGFTRSAVTGNRWFKVVTLGGSPKRLKLSIIATGDNTNSYDNFLISTSGYGMNMHIQKLPGGKYNTSKLVSVAAINPSNSGSVEIWIQLMPIVSNTGLTYVACTSDVLDATTILASSTATAPTLTGNDTQLDISNDNRLYATLQTSRGATFGAKVGIGTNSPAAMLTVAGGDATISGNVGIGLTNPGQKLEVAGNIKAHDGYIRSEDGSSGDFMQMFNDGAGTGYSYITTSANELVLIPQNGKLQLKGENYGSGNNASLEIYNALNAAVKVKLHSNGDSYLNGGNVGIGTTSPIKKLHVKETSGTYEAAIFETNSGGSFIRNIDSTGTVETGVQGGKWSARTSNTQRLVIDSSGNVGIKTTSPSYLLDVRDGTTSGAIARFSAINSHVIIESSTAGNAVLHLKPNTTGAKNGQFKVTAGNGYGFSWSNDAAGTGETAYMDLDTSTTGGGDLTVKGDVIAYGAPSDRKYKENIKPIESALDKAMQLQGVTFDWKDSDSILDIKEDIGFIAQDVQEVLPELVRDSGKGNLSLRYQGITPILLEAIKELKAEIDLLKSKPCTCNKCNCNI